ncbi:MAG TPA: hypothetical protein PK409_09470 [Thermosynergistes sp.]|jgi:hypothetical protein|nr:hypothetical protein [Thermosynergistes sp.]HPZ76891.1 hypothetical protein [Thermosynergistes sp.]HQE22145.1 hypothetical protein [Thermosynergistes sp.]HXK89923.1 hypothetical protein [Thermosynergistes sp.]
MKINGKDMELKYTVNSIRALIRETGKTPAQIMGGGFDPTDFDLGVKLIWAGLLWSNPKLTVDIVGNWLDAEGGTYSEAIMEATKALVAAFERQFGTAAGKDDEAKN